MEQSRQTEEKTISLVAKIGTQNRLYTLSSQDRMTFVTRPMLARLLPADVGAGPTSFVVSYGHMVSQYHRYEGGPIWMPTVPGDLAKPGDRLRIQVKLLTTREFINAIPKLEFVNSGRMRWASDESTAVVSPEDRRIRFSMEQTPSVEGIADFRFECSSEGRLGFRAGQTSLGLMIEDDASVPKRLRIAHDGRGKASLGLWTGHFCSEIRHVSSDGVRLRLSYSRQTNGFRTATAYLKLPSTLFSIGATSESPLRSITPSPADAFSLPVRPARQLEKAMLGGTSYDHGRLGAEIAYAVARERLGLRNVMLNEPSLGGRDLYAEGGEVSIQARMLYVGALARNRRRMENQQLKNLLWKLGQDFRYNRRMQRGFAVFTTFASANDLTAHVIEIRRGSIC